MAAFFFGYITTQIIGGILAQRVGGKLLMLGGVFWTALMTLLTPVLTIYGDFPALFAVRFVEGIGEVCNEIIVAFDLLLIEASYLFHYYKP